MVGLARCNEPWNRDLGGEGGRLRYGWGELERALDDLGRYAAENLGGTSHPAAIKMLEALRVRLGKGESLR